MDELQAKVAELADRERAYLSELADYAKTVTGLRKDVERWSRLADRHLKEGLEKDKTIAELRKAT